MDGKIERKVDYNPSVDTNHWNSTKVKCNNKKELDKLKIVEKALEKERDIQAFSYKKEKQEVQKQLDAFEREKQKIKVRNEPKSNQTKVYTGQIPAITNVTRSEYSGAHVRHNRDQRSHSFHPKEPIATKVHDAAINRLKIEQQKLLQDQKKKHRSDKDLRQLHMSHGRLVDHEHAKKSSHHTRFPALSDAKINDRSRRASLQVPHDHHHYHRRGSLVHDHDNSTIAAIHKENVTHKTKSHHKQKAPSSFRDLVSNGSSGSRHAQRKIDHTQAKSNASVNSALFENVLNVHDHASKSKHHPQTGDKNFVPMWADPKHHALDEEKLQEYHDLLSKVNPKELALLMFSHMQHNMPGSIAQHQATPHKRKLLALEILIRQLPDIRKELTKFKFDPVEMLSCRYLRLSKNNVERLTTMCEDSGIDVGIHPHMTESQVTEFFNTTLGEVSPEKSLSTQQ
ncbi:unnamed protein product [Owenia fusiformis]|uniref:Uncharacterized protein n=1 Tax=Owenia fusiformis TaxID=6347 RepID=A0A8J1UJX5_OWEFU|nr:unnamed protein product [Owenia fusiformis]